MGMQGTREPGIFVARATFILLPTMPDLRLTFFWLLHFEGPRFWPILFLRFLFFRKFSYQNFIYLYNYMNLCKK
jgi:hypothetical protein